MIWPQRWMRASELAVAILNTLRQYSSGRVLISSDAHRKLYMCVNVLNTIDK